MALDVEVCLFFNAGGVLTYRTCCWRVLNLLFLSQVSDLVIILNQRRAIEAFTKGGNLTLGGNLTVAVGPVGRSAPPSFRGFDLVINTRLSFQT